MPFRPKRQSRDVLAPTVLSPLRHEINGTPESAADVNGSHVVAKLEASVDGVTENGLNGHAPP